MTKSRLRPIAGASRRSSRAHSAWKVEIHMRLQSEPASDPTRARISSAALLVNVTARTSHGLAWPSPTRYAARLVMTRVLPEPAPARISSGPSTCRTASCCSGLRDSRNCIVLGARGSGLGTIYLSLPSSSEPRALSPGLFDRDALREVARLVDVAAAPHGDVVGEQ